MRVVRAAWVCPVARPPMANGWVALDGPRIHAVGGAEDPTPAGARIVSLPEPSAVMPGLINAHTHLELSWLAGKIPPAARMTDWVGHLVRTRGRRPESADDARAQDAARRAAADARAAGTSAVGDVSNSLTTPPHIAAAGMRGVVFHEVIGFRASGALVAETRPLRDAARGVADVRISLAPHAPYSTSADLFRAVRREVDASDVPVMSVHVGESIDETEMLERGTGAWPDLLRRVGAWQDGWTPPGAGPVEYLDSLGVLDARTLVVHAVTLADASLAVLARLGCTIVTCPRSNRWVGAGAPPVARFYEAGLRVAVGTDSLASSPDLNLFGELKDMRWLAPRVPASRLIASATIDGARALGLDCDLGTIEPGKRADIVSIRLPGRIDDVEEYLAGGIEPSQVAWL